MDPEPDSTKASRAKIDKDIFMAISPVFADSVAEDSTTAYFVSKIENSHTEHSNYTRVNSIPFPRSYGSSLMSLRQARVEGLTVTSCSRASVALLPRIRHNAPTDMNKGLWGLIWTLVSLCGLGAVIIIG